MNAMHRWLAMVSVTVLTWVAPAGALAQPNNIQAQPQLLIPQPGLQFAPNQGQNQNIRGGLQMQPQGGQPPQNPPPGMTPDDFWRLLQEALGVEDPYNGNPPSRRGMQQSAPGPPVEPIVPTREQLSRISLENLREVVRRAVVSLDGDLARFTTGDEWKEHFQTRTIRQMVGPASTLPPDPSDRAVMAATVERMKSVSGNPKYNMISSLWGFQTLEAALPELALPPVDRDRRDLARRTLQLSDGLARLSTGSSWKAFLQLDELTRMSQAMGELTTAERDALVAIAARWDRTADDPEYRPVTQTQGFGPAYDQIQRMIAASGPPGQATRGQNSQPAAVAGGATIAVAPEGPNINVAPGGPSMDALPNGPSIVERGSSESPRGGGSGIAQRSNPGPSRRGPAPQLLADLIITKVEYSQTAPTATITVLNQGEAAAPASRLRVVLLDYNAPPPTGWIDPKENTKTPPPNLAAGAAPAEINLAGLTLSARAAPILFVPFEVRSPQSGQLIRRSATIEIPIDDVAPTQDATDPNAPAPALKTRQVEAGAYYDALNRIEADLNAKGYSLRTPGEATVAATANVNYAALADQTAQLRAAHKNVQWEIRPRLAGAPGPAPAAPPPNPATTLQTAPTTELTIPGMYDIPPLAIGQSRTIDVQSPNRTLGFYGQSRFLVDATMQVPESREYNNTWIDNQKRLMPFVPEDERRLLTQSVDRAESWRQELGDSDYFSAYLTAGAHLHADMDGAGVGFSAGTGAKIFGHSIEMLDIHANAYAPAKGEGTTSLDVSVMGQSKIVDASAGQNEVTENIHYEAKARFMLGPVPIAATFGARGEAGFVFKLTAQDGAATVEASPFVHTTAYGSADIDILVGGAGVAGDINLVSYDGYGVVEAAVHYDPTDDVRSYLEEYYAYRHSVSALDGSISARAYVYYPTFDPFPDLKKKTWSWEIFKWDGFRYPAEGTAVLFGVESPRRTPLLSSEP